MARPQADWILCGHVTFGLVCSLRLLPGTSSIAVHLHFIPLQSLHDTDLRYHGDLGPSYK